MVIRIIVIFLCLGILSTANGCAVGPSASGTLAPYWVIRQPEPYQGPDYEREIDKEVEQYRQRRSAQEREQERARERDPRWEWQR